MSTSVTVNCLSAHSSLSWVRPLVIASSVTSLHGNACKRPRTVSTRWRHICIPHWQAWALYNPFVIPLLGKLTYVCVSSTYVVFTKAMGAFSPTKILAYSKASWALLFQPHTAPLFIKLNKGQATWTGWCMKIHRYLRSPKCICSRHRLW